MRRGRVAEVDRDLEVLEGALLQPPVTELGDEPRRLRTVVADEAHAGPRFEVVEHGPEAFRARGIAGARRELEQLRSQDLVAAHVTATRSIATHSAEDTAHSRA